MFLTQNELFLLTNYKYSSKQIMWLREQGFKHTISSDGKPRVLKCYIENVLGAQGKMLERTEQPNFKAIAAHF